MYCNNVDGRKVEFVFHVELKGYTRDHVSSTVSLSNIQWMIKIRERQDENEMIFEAALSCLPPNNSNHLDWRCRAMATVSLRSHAKNRLLNEKNIPETMFEIKRLSSTTVEIMRSSDLAQYKQNGYITFDVQLFVNPVFYQTASNIDHMLTKFKFNVDNVNELEKKASISPNVIMGGTAWNVFVQKNQDHLDIFLSQINSAMNINWSWMVKCSFTLLSFDKHVQPVRLWMEKNFTLGLANWGFTGFISWKTFMDPALKYVKNGKAIFEINLEVDSPKPLWKFDEKPSKNTECSICLQDFQSPAATKCGHLFCNACIRKSVDQYKKCPNCNAVAQLKDIRPIFL